MRKSYVLAIAIFSLFLVGSSRGIDSRKFHYKEEQFFNQLEIVLKYAAQFMKSYLTALIDSQNIIKLVEIILECALKFMKYSGIIGIEDMKCECSVRSGFRKLIEEIDIGDMKEELREIRFPIEDILKDCKQREEEPKNNIDEYKYMIKHPAILIKSLLKHSGIIVYPLYNITFLPKGSIYYPKAAAYIGIAFRNLFLNLKFDQPLIGFNF